MEHNWYKFNQTYLLAGIAEIRHLIMQYRKQANKNDIISTFIKELPPANAEATLEILCQYLQLSAFDRKVILLCAGVELEKDFASLCATAQNSSYIYPTVGFILDLFKEDYHGLMPQASLRYWHLIEIIPAESFVMSQCKIAEPILNYLVGDNNIHETLQAWLKPIQKPVYAINSHLTIAEQIKHYWMYLPTELSRPLLQLYGENLNNIENIVMLACQSMKFPLYSIDCKSLPTNIHELQKLQRLLMRETLLKDIIYLIIFLDSDTEQIQQNGMVLAKQLNGRCIIVTPQPLAIVDFPVANFAVGKLTLQEQLEVWYATLPQNIVNNIASLTEDVSQFDFSIAQIQSICAMLVAQCKAVLNTYDLRSVLRQLCQTQARKYCDGLVQFVNCRAGWNNLILPETQKQILNEIMLHVKERYKVYQEWGFAEKNTRGLGISALFAGPSGTGKTLAAEVLAKELQMDLYHIDLSAVVSKYIGETEKNLQKIFTAAENNGAILLFDEADALFGKRSEVKDSHDRYANIEVSYLLQRIEAYRGLSILTTNAREVLDNAFLRRIRFVVNFSFPDQTLRTHIWQQIFPEELPTQNIDFNKLSRLSLPGGNIRNIALSAAFIAAGDSQSVSMQHLLQATKNEYLKLGRTLVTAEIGDW